jgi:hypothetical protein
VTAARAGVLAFALLVPTAAWAYRPFVSTDAAVAPPQEVEIELGYFGVERAHGQNTFVVPHVVLNYGFIRDCELVGDFQVAWPPGEDVQLVDPELSVKTVLKEGVLQEREGMSFAIEAGPLLPSTIPGEHSFGFEAAGILSGRLASVTYHLNGGGGVDRVNTNPFVMWGVITELPVRPQLRLVSEINGESAENERAANSGLFGFIWQPGEADVFLDAAFRKGFSQGADDWAFTTGLTFSFLLPGSPPT